MKRIVYSKHLEMRLQLREIPYRLSEEIFLGNEERYFDQETELYIVVGKADYKGKFREFAVTYRERGDSSILLITIHPLKPNQKMSRIKSRRWKPL